MALKRLQVVGNVLCLCISPHVPTIYNCISKEPGFCKDPPPQTEFLFLKKDEEWSLLLLLPILENSTWQQFIEWGLMSLSLSHTPCVYHCSSCCPRIVNTASSAQFLSGHHTRPGHSWSLQQLEPQPWPLVSLARPNVIVLCLNVLSRQENIGLHCIGQKNVS